AFQEAGLADGDVIISNAQGSESTQLTQAQAAITQGATVLVLDPISSGVGAAIEQYAAEQGVPVIDYDRLTLGGARDYYEIGRASCRERVEHHVGAVRSKEDG